MSPDKALTLNGITEILEEFGLETNGFVAESAEGVLTRFDEDETTSAAVESDELAAA